MLTSRVSAVEERPFARFTLHGGPAAAGAVTATAMAVAVIGQAFVYRRSTPRPVLNLSSTAP